jgi:hypothetical protein
MCATGDKRAGAGDERPGAGDKRAGGGADKPRSRRMGRFMVLVFGVAWVIGQATLVLSADARPDHIFGFRMFPEASTLEIHLWRDTKAGAVAAAHGEWSARDGSGQLRHFAWRDRVRDPVLAAVDTRVFASYGVDAQLARLGRALDDVADHIAGDGETRRLRAEVVVRKNGAPPVTVRLAGHPRDVGP